MIDDMWEIEVVVVQSGRVKVLLDGTSDSRQ